MEIKFWGRNVVGAAPLGNKIFSMLEGSLCLVETLKSTIVASVKTPGFMKGDP